MQTARILAVDDTPINLKLLTRTLEKAGYSILQAENGEKALQMAASENPDLILLDVMMPGKDGFEVCEILKKDEQTKHIPVIFLTSKNEMVDKVRGLEVGAVDYITKPFDPVEVKARAKTHIRLKNLHQELLVKNDQLEKTYEDLQKKTERINKDIKAAGVVQRQLLPQNINQIRNLKFAWQFVPSSHVAGDIFNILYLDKKHVAIFMVDVSGHGVQSAMLAVSVHNFFRSGINNANPPDSIEANSPLYYLLEPEKVAAQLNQNFPMEAFDAFFTCVYMVIDLETLKAKIVNGGHPYPMIIHGDNSFEYIEQADIPLGMMGDAEFSVAEFQLRKNDRLIMYTDGIFEVPVDGGAELGRETLAEMLVIPEPDLEQHFKNTVATVLDKSIHSEFDDDVSLFGLQVL